MLIEKSSRSGMEEDQQSLIAQLEKLEKSKTMKTERHGTLPKLED